jgi:nicotinamidase-related amidase
MTTALLIIDVQQALTASDDAAFESQRVIERINQVSQHARSADAAVVLIQHEEGEGPLVHGEEGWQLATTLDETLGQLGSFGLRVKVIEAAEVRFDG